MKESKNNDHLKSIDGINRGIYKLPSYQLDSLLCRLHEREIVNHLSNLEINEKILIYYRVSKNCKRKITRVISGLYEIIKKLEQNHLYLTRLENLMIFNSKITFEQLMKLIDLSNSNTFVKEYIALEDDQLKFLGLIYATDIIINYSLQQKNYIHSSLHSTKLLQIRCDKKKCDGILMTEEELESYHRLIVIDEKERILGSIETERILDNHDIYMNPEGMLYAIEKQDFKRIGIVLSTSIIGGIVSTFISLSLKSGEEGLCTLIMVKCINDTITLIIVEDKIAEESFNKYYIHMIILISLLSSLVFYTIFNEISAVLNNILSINLICILTTKMVQVIYKYNKGFGIVPVILIPEIIAPSAIFAISKIINSNYRI